MVAGGHMRKMKNALRAVCRIDIVVAAACVVFVLCLDAYGQNSRVLSGIVVTANNELVPGIKIVVRTGKVELGTLTDADGRFSIAVPGGPLSILFSGNNIAPVRREF